MINLLFDETINRLNKGLAGLEAGDCEATVSYTHLEQKKELMDLYRRMDGSIGNIQYYNQKAEALAKSELEQMGIDSRYVGNPTGIYGRPAFNKGSKLEKKA